MKEKIVNNVIKTGIILTGLLCGIAAFTECFSISYSMPVVFFFSINILLIFVLIYETEHRLLYYGICAVGFGIVGLCTFSYIRIGLLSIVNLLLQRYYQYFGTDVLYQYEIELFGRMRIESYHTFAICALMVVFIAIMLLFTWHRVYAVPHICFLIMVIGVPAALGELPSRGIMMGLILYGLCCMMARQTSSISKLGLLYILVFGTLGYVVALHWIQPQSYEINVSLAAVRKSVRDVLYSFDFDKLLKTAEMERLEFVADLEGTWASGGDSQGKLGSVDSIQFSNEPMLRLAVEQPANLYLKGFSANEYTGSDWKLQVGEQYEQLAQELSYDADLYAYKALSMPETVLYDILGDIESRKKISIWKTRQNKTDVLFYPYASRINMDLPKWDYYLLEDKEKSEKEILKDTQGKEQEYFAGRRYDYQLYTLGSILSMQGMSVKDKISAYLDEKTLNELNLYKEYVYDTCMQVPSGLQKLFQRLIPDAPHFNGEPESFVDCMSYVAFYLQDNTTYTLNPGRRKTSDFVKEFLTVKKRGYCTSYASTAALMLRYMGIPTRYATGYFVSKSEIEAGRYNTEMKKYIVDVKDTDAHAWTEVFLDPFGFVPIDVTPGYYYSSKEEESTSAQTQTTTQLTETTTSEEASGSEKLETTVNSETTGIETTKMEETKDTEEENTIDSDGNPTADEGWGTFFGYLVAGSLLLISLLVVVWISRMRKYAGGELQESQEETAEEPDVLQQRRKAMIASGECFLLELEQIGIIYKDGWMMDSTVLLARISELYGAFVTEQETKIFLELYQKAKYSAEFDKFSEEEYEKVVNYVDKCKNSLQSAEK